VTPDRSLATVVVLMLALAAVPLFVGSDYWMDMLIVILFFGFLGQSWNLVGGYAGQYSFGHAAFFGCGAYAMAVLQLRFGLTPWIALPLAGAIGAAVATAIGALSFRYQLRGSYFALVTLAFAEIFLVLANSTGFTNGGMGLMLPTKPGLANLQFAAKAGYFYLILAMTAASLLLRRFAWANAEIHDGNYAAFRARMLADNLSGLDGLTVGVVGMGVIGLAVAQAFQKAGCKLCYFDPAPRAAAAPGTRAATLDELLQSCDVVSVHVPLLPATAGLIGERQLAAMKSGAVLVQASRGGIVDEAALAAHLRSGHLGGAAVDVYSTEPPDAANPLLALDGEAAHRLLLTPHIAGVTRQSAAFLFRSAWSNVERVLLKGEAPLNRVY